MALVNFQVMPAVRVDAVLVTPPPSKTKTGAIVWMHSGGVFQQLPDAMLLGEAGAVSLVINPILPNWNGSPETWRQAMVQAVVSVRRALDLLLRRSDTDAERLA